MSCVRWHEARGTDLPVLMPSATQIARAAAAERTSGFFTLRLRPAHGAALLLLFIIGCGVAQHACRVCLLLFCNKQDMQIAHIGARRKFAYFYRVALHVACCQLL